MTVQHAIKPAPLTQPHIGASVKAPSPTIPHEQLVKKTQVWVAQTFFGTLLKQMHDSPFRSELFDGGRGGQAFGALYDQRLCERMSKGVGSKLVNAIVRKIEGKTATKPITKTASAAYAKQKVTGARR
jgi:Rod binding domain-containing protein